jgi:hypothetical protein
MFKTLLQTPKSPRGTGQNPEGGGRSNRRGSVMITEAMITHSRAAPAPESAASSRGSGAVRVRLDPRLPQTVLPTFGTFDGGTAWNCR